MEKEKLHKLEGYTDSLLTLLINSYSQYVFLRPMMFNVELIARYGGGIQRKGFNNFRHVLYRTLILEIVKLCEDSDPRSPSISGLRRELESKEVEAFLENRYTRPRWPRLVGDTDESYAQAQEDDSAQSRERFRESFSQFLIESEALLKSDELLALKATRDKQVAHNEVRFVSGKYQFALIADLQYGFERKVLEAAQRIVILLTSVVRQTSFDWNSFYEPEVKSVCAFWEIDELGEPIKI